MPITTPSSDVPLPKWPLESKLTDCVSLLKVVFFDMRDVVCDVEKSALLCQRIMSHYKLESDHQRLAVAASLSKYTGKPLTKHICRQLIYRLVWGADLLKTGFSLVDFTGTSSAMWMPFLIDNAEYSLQERGAKKRMMVQLSLLVIGGTAAGTSVTKLMPSGYAYTFSKSLGFNRKYPYEKPSHLCSLRFAGFVEPSLAEDLQFSKYAMTSAMRRHNKAIIHEKIQPVCGGRPQAEA